MSVGLNCLIKVKSLCLRGGGVQLFDITVVGGGGHLLCSGPLYSLAGFARVFSSSQSESKSLLDDPKSTLDYWESPPIPSVPGFSNHIFPILFFRIVHTIISGMA